MPSIYGSASKMAKVCISIGLPFHSRNCFGILSFFIRDPTPPANITAILFIEPPLTINDVRLLNNECPYNLYNYYSYQYIRHRASPHVALQEAIAYSRPKSNVDNAHSQP